MGTSRLSHAIGSGNADLTGGPVLVFRPPATADLSGLDRNKVTVVHGFRPEFEVWQGRGYDCIPSASEPCQKPGAAIVFVPRSKDLAHQLVAEALTATGGGPVVIDGQKTDGVESLIRTARQYGLRAGDVLSMRHGKLVTLWGDPPGAWQQADRTLAGGWVTRPGVFSADGIDPGSALLAAAWSDTIAGRVADIGAGWGYLSARLLADHPDIGECHLVEAEIDALEAARHNVTDARAQFHWADIRSWGGKAGFDHVIANPPFHAGRRADPGLGIEFVAAAQRLLMTGGTLWLVANRQLPYEQALRARFAAVREIAGNAVYKIFRADRPRPGAG